MAIPRINRGQFLSTILQNITDATQHVDISKSINFTDNIAPKVDEIITVAIIGAGITGIYVADLLKNYPNIKVTIFESTERVGGRIRTHYFQDNYDGWQYIDVGAMRIPETHVEVRSLITELGLNLIDYYFTDSVSNLYYLNKTRDDKGNIMNKKYAAENPDKIGFLKIIIPDNTVPDSKRFIETIADDSVILLVLKDPANDRSKWENVPAIYNNIYNILAKKLEEMGVAKFFAKYDQYSVQSYFRKKIPNMLKIDCVYVPSLNQVNHLIESVLDFAELDSTSTGLNHLALTEGVMDNRHFDAKNWYALAGGMELLPKTLFKKVMDEPRKYPVEYHDNTEVFKINLNQEESDGVILHAYQNGAEIQRHFHRVIITAPFSSVRRMDISPGFSYFKTQAIRSFNYDHSTKVCLQVPHRFWEINKEGTDIPIHRGGQSRTDLPLLNVVYPCYPNLPVPTPGKGCLIASYSWQNEAVLWANMDESERKRLCIRNLKELHGVELKPEEVEIYTHVWNEAFAMFGPGQYSELYKAMLPEWNCHFAGEHLSTEHAWILGCLYSAKRAVRELLYMEGLEDAISSWNKFPDKDFDQSSWLNYVRQLRIHHRQEE